MSRPMDDAPQDLTRSFDLALSPAEALTYLRRRLPDTSAESGLARIHRPTPTGFFLVPGERRGRRSDESLPAIRVTFTAHDGGARVVAAWAGLVETGIPSHVFLALLLPGLFVGLFVGPAIVPALLLFVARVGAAAYHRRAYERERGTHFADLIAALETALRPLPRAGAPTATADTTPRAIRPARQPGTVEVTLAGLVHALTEAAPGQAPPAHLVQLDPDAAALARYFDHALIVILRHDPARATAEQLDARLAAVLGSERPDVLAGLSTGPVLAAILGDVDAAAVAAAPTFSRTLGRPVQWCVIATDGLVEPPAPDVLRHAAMAARRLATPDPGTLAARERHGEDRVGAAGAEHLFGQATNQVLRAPATLGLGLVLLAISVLQSVWLGRQSADDLLRMGGMEETRALAGEWWRLLSSGLVHLDPGHLGGNLSMLFICYFAELAIGPARYLVLFTASVLAGSLLAAAASPPNTVIVGASSGIFGLASALLVLTWREPRLLPGRHGARLKRTFLALLGLNLLLSLLPGISLSGHLGGALAGAFLAGSGALTWRQPRAWMDERPDPGVTWLVRGLALACLLASAVALALAWAHGRPWAP